VRFNGLKAWIKISNAYKEGQCGLCGHYNDEAGDEWRMSNNEQTTDLAAFHRSFSLQEDRECTTDEHQQFYQQNKDKFGFRTSSQQNKKGNNKKSGGQQNSWEDEGYGSSAGGRIYSQEQYSSNEQQRYNSREQQQDDEQEQGWWGQQQKQQRRWNQRRGGNKKQGSSSSSSGASQEMTEEPVKKTKVIEYNHMICFSTQPVKQCPEGTSSADQQQQQQESTNQDYSQEQQQQKNKQAGPGSKKVQFTCLPRSSIEARRLQRQARQGVVVDVSAYQPSFVEAVQQPTRCVRY